MVKEKSRKMRGYVWWQKDRRGNSRGKSRGLDSRGRIVGMEKRNCKREGGEKN